jgi:hypothetical protein
MKVGDTVEHIDYGITEVVHYNPQRDMAVVRDSRGLCYLMLQSEIIEKIEDNIRWQEAGF